MWQKHTGLQMGKVVVVVWALNLEGLFHDFFQLKHILHAAKPIGFQMGTHQAPAVWVLLFSHHGISRR